MTAFKLIFIFILFLYNICLEYSNQNVHRVTVPVSFIYVQSILQFDIDISSIHINQSELIFKLKTWSASEEKDIKDNTFSLSLAIQLIADITITG